MLPTILIVSIFLSLGQTGAEKGLIINPPILAIPLGDGESLAGGIPEEFVETGRLYLYRHGTAPTVGERIETTGLSAAVSVRRLPYFDIGDNMARMVIVYDGSNTMQFDDCLEMRAPFARCLAPLFIPRPIEIPFPLNEAAFLQFFRPNEELDFNEVLQTFTSSETLLRSAASRASSQGFTPLYDATLEALEYLGARSDPSDYSLLFVISDGASTEEKREVELIDFARTLDIPIFALGIRPPTFSDCPSYANLDTLESMSFQTGGRYEEFNYEIPNCPGGDIQSNVGIALSNIFSPRWEIVVDFDVRHPPGTTDWLPLGDTSTYYYVPDGDPETREFIPNAVCSVDLGYVSPALDGQTLALFADGDGIDGPGYGGNYCGFSSLLTGQRFEPGGFVELISDSSLAAVDILLILPPSRPLSPAEQLALARYVEHGGGLVTFTERGPFAALLDSIANPLGVFGVGGDRPPETTIIAPDHPVIDGPFGLVTELSPQMPGAFDIASLPEGAEVLATTSDGHAAIVAMGPEMGLPVCSGRVILFNDIDMLNAYRIDKGDNAAVFMNALEYVARTIPPSPGVTIEQGGGQTDPAHVLPIVFDVEFDLPVIGFDSDDSDDVDVIFSGSAGALDYEVDGEGSSYRVIVTDVLPDGTVRARIPAGIAEAFIGECVKANLESISADDTVTYDCVPPSVTVDQAVGQADPARSVPIRFDVVFDRAVTGFDANDTDDIDVVFFGSAGDVEYDVEGSGREYQVVVTDIASDGTVSPRIPAGVVAAATGQCAESSTASTSDDDTVNFDSRSPLAALNQQPAQLDPTPRLPVRFNVVFDEPVMGFDDDDSDDRDVLFLGTAEGVQYSVEPMKTDYVVNGGFEAGDFTRWVVYNRDAGAGEFATDTDAISPIELKPTAGPASGDFFAISDQNGPGAHAIIQRLETEWGESVRTFVEYDVFVNSIGGTSIPIYGPGLEFAGAANQYGLVDVLRRDAGPFSVSDSDVLEVLYADVGRLSPPNPYLRRSHEITEAVNAARGKIALRFAEVANRGAEDFGRRGFLNMGVDNVRLYTEPSGVHGTYTIVVTAVEGPGTLVPFVPGGRAFDAASNGNAASTSTDNSVEYVLGSLASIRLGGPIPAVTATGPVTFEVTYGHANEISLDAGDVALHTTGTATGAISVSTGDADTRFVTLSNISGQGTLAVEIVAGTAVDQFGADAPGAGPSAAARVDNREALISVSPSTFDYGEVPEGLHNDAIFTVSNNGTDDLHGAVDVSGEYQVVTGSPYTVSAGGTTQVAIRFSPDAAGEFEATAFFSGEGGADFPVNLSGTGFEVPRPEIEISPESWDFGYVKIGSSANANIRATNPGDSSVSVAAETAAPFAITSGADFSLGANQSRFIGIGFSPVGPGFQAEVVTLDVVKGAVFQVSGTGVSALGGIEGSLLDPVTGEGISCAAVIVSDGESVQIISVAGESGSFTFPKVPGGAYAVSVIAPGYVGAESAVEISDGEIESVDFELTARTGAADVSGDLTVEGAAIDLGGIHVVALINGEVAAETYSCADGRYELDLPIEEGVVVVRFEGPGGVLGQTKVTLGSGETVIADAVLDPAGGSATGRIEGEVALNGKDTAAAARVTASGRRMTVSVAAAASGAYSLDGLVPGAYRVTASAAGYVSTIEETTLYAATASTINFELEAEEVEPPPPPPDGCAAGEVRAGSRALVGDGFVLGASVILIVLGSAGASPSPRRPHRHDLTVCDSEASFNSRKRTQGTQKRSTIRLGRTSGELT